MRIGSSGARVEDHGDRAVKVGDARVGEQGRWLRRNSCDSLPRVIDVSTWWYSMEWLQQLPAQTPDVVVDRLELVWAGDPEIDCSLDDVLEYGEDRLKLHPWPAAERTLLLYGAALAPHWERLPRCRTHGDPTRSNTMTRQQTGAVVLIDPLPPKVGVPSIRAVDLGKVLQSCLGYESERFGWPFGEWVDNFGWLNRFTRWEYAATRMFTLIHFIRLMPYMPNGETRRRMRALAEPLLRI